MTIRISIVLTTLLGFLAGCGGGGGGGGSLGETVPPPSEQPPPNEEPSLPPDAPLVSEPSSAGLWEGTGPDGRKVTAWGGDEYYGGFNLFYTAADNEAIVAGLITGYFWRDEYLLINGGGAVDFNFEGGGAIPARVEATVVDSGDSLGIKVFTGRQFADFREEVTLSRSPASRRILVLADVIGVYEGELSGAGGTEHIRLTIDEAGKIATSGGSGCEVAGRILAFPFVSSYTVQFTFSGSSCAYSSGRELWGTGIYDPDNNRLLIGVDDNASPYPEHGAAFSGRREVEADFDSDGLPDSEDQDDDNDGVADTGDDCPWDTNHNCPHTMLADDMEWLQPKDFSGLRWEDIDAVCPAEAGGPCDGVLRGREMSGWAWASAEEVRTLLTAYGFEPAPADSMEQPDPVGQGPLPKIGQEASYAWEQAGWRPTSVLCPWDCYFQFLSYTRDWSGRADSGGVQSAPGLYIYPGYDYNTGLVWETESTATGYFGVQGGWFYRQRQQGSAAPATGNM